MISLISLVNTSIFLLIALLHVYWVIGGKWGLEAAMPAAWQDSYHAHSLIMKLATLAVAIGLFAFAGITLSHYHNFFERIIPAVWITRVTAMIGLIFLARAIGDFNYCGFFRKLKEGVFAENDKMIYAPLCLYLGLSMLFLAYK